MLNWNSWWLDPKKSKTSGERLSGHRSAYLRRKGVRHQSKSRRSWCLQESTDDVKSSTQNDERESQSVRGRWQLQRRSAKLALELMDVPRI